MKKYLLFACLILLLFFSCPSQLIKRTFWSGYLLGEMGDPSTFTDKHGLEIYFHGDSSARAVISLNFDTGASLTYGYEGSYRMFDNSMFIAYFEDVIDPATKVELTLTGLLDTSTHKGKGKYYFNDQLNDASGDWDLYQVY